MHRIFFSVSSVFLWPVDTPVEGSGVPEGCLRNEMGAHAGARAPHNVTAAACFFYSITIILASFGDLGERKFSE